MISITNIETLSEYLRRYRVAINKKEICTFKHDRRKGLAVCLKKAADAVEIHLLEMGTIPCDTCQRVDCKCSPD